MAKVVPSVFVREPVPCTVWLLMIWKRPSLDNPISLIPMAAVFLATVQLGYAGRRTLVLVLLAFAGASALLGLVQTLYGFGPETRYLSPAPLYHAAPQAAVSLAVRNGGTAIIMERFDPRAVPGAGRDLQGDAQPAGADHVLAHAQIARGDAAPL